MKFNCEIIDHKDQRCSGNVGDYWQDYMGTWQVRASRLPNLAGSIAILIHEIQEIYLTQRDGIREPDIQAFDEKFFEEVYLHKHDSELEPGDDFRAPYRKQHQAATHVERASVSAGGLTWEDYEKMCNNVF